MKKIFFAVFILAFLACCNQADKSESAVVSSNPQSLASSQSAPSSAADTPAKPEETDDSPVIRIYDMYIYQPETRNYKKIEVPEERISMKQAFDKVAAQLGIEAKAHSFSFMPTQWGDVDRYWPVIDLDGGFIDRELSNAAVEESFLNSVSATVRDQYMVSAAITFLRDGGAYRSAHLSMEADEAYHQRAISIGTLSPEEYTQLRAMAEYQGLSREGLIDSEGFDYLIAPPGKRGKEFVELLSRVSLDIEYDSPKDIPDRELIHIGILSTDSCLAQKDSQLWAIAESVQDEIFDTKEHIETSIKEIFGEVPDITHGDIVYGGVAYYRWHENEGVYTPPHMGGGLPQAIILESEEQSDRYVLTVVYISHWIDLVRANEDELKAEEHYKELQNRARNEAPKYKVVLLKQPDGRVTVYSQHLL